MSRLILVFSTLLLLFLAFENNFAHAEEGRHTLGAQAGQVGLLGDVGTTYGNALGYGVFFDYAASDWLELELNFLASKHSSNNLNLSQNAYAAYMIYNIDQLDAFVPYLKLGAEFVSHTQDLAGNTGTFSSGQFNSGFGLDVGAGGKFILGSNVSAGLDLTYHSVFDVSSTPPLATASQKVIQSYYTVMFRLGFEFGKAK